MIAILRWTDGFGNDTYVKGIYPSLAEAKKNYEEGDRYIYFRFGEVDFDWYEADQFPIEPDEEEEGKKGR